MLSYRQKEGKPIVLQKVTSYFLTQLAFLELNSAYDVMPYTVVQNKLKLQFLLI